MTARAFVGAVVLAVAADVVTAYLAHGSAVLHGIGLLVAGAGGWWVGGLSTRVRRRP